MMKDNEYSSALHLAKIFKLLLFFVFIWLYTYGHS